MCSSDLLQPLHQRMLRGVVVFVVSCDGRDSRVDQESAEDEMHQEHRVHQVFTNEDEHKPEENSTANAKVKWSVLEMVWRGVRGEDEVKDEKIVEGEHPLKHVATHPHGSLVRAIVMVDPATEGASTENPK